MVKLEMVPGEWSSLIIDESFSKDEIDVKHLAVVGTLTANPSNARHNQLASVNLAARLELPSSRYGQMDLLHGLPSSA